MTEKTAQEKPEQRDGDVVAEEPSQEQKDAEAGFAAGFRNVRGGDKPSGEETTTASDTSTETQGEPKKDAAATGTAAAQAAAAPAEDPWKGVPEVVRREFDSLRALPGQIRNLAGQIGGMNSKLQGALATAKAAATAQGGAAAAPSDRQIQAASTDPKLWEKLKEDYPDWATPLEAIFADMRKEIAAAKGPAVDVKAIKADVTSGVRAEISAGLDAAEERAFVRLKHPGWKETVNTPEFKSWTLQGGPSIEQYTQMKALEQTDPARAEAMVNGWTRQFPQWWADRGAAIFDERADAAIKLLDGYAAHRTQAASTSQRKEKGQERLERSVPARSSGGAPASTGISDEQAFERGFKRGRGSK